MLSDGLLPFFACSSVLKRLPEWTRTDCASVNGGGRSGVVGAEVAMDSRCMDDIKHQHDYPSLTFEQIRDLAMVVLEDLGGKLSRADFTESLLMLLEDVPGFEAGQVDTRLIELAWAIYNGRLSDF